MKKVFFVVVLVLVSVAVFGQETRLRTSDGVYYVSILYQGQNIGQETYNRNIAAARGMSISVYNLERLTNGQWEAVNYLLNRYQTTRGDTYFIRIGLDERFSSYIVVICEFTSNTEYRYWAYRAI